MAQTFRQGYAVIVGVGADLPVTINDATAIANLLRNSSRCAYPTKQVRLLTGKEATATNILSALNWLADVTEKDDTAIVYFSGHGIEIPDYYLIPYGYNPENLQNTAILGSIFTEHLQAILAKKLLVILDCCHAGGQAEAKGGIKSPLPPSAITQLGSSSGRVIFASSRKDEVSFTGDPYSKFTAALLEGLAGYGAFEQDGCSRVLDLAMWVGRKVPERTKDKQHPIIKVNNLEDNFAVAWYAAGEKRPYPLPNWTDNIPSGTQGLDTVQLASVGISDMTFNNVEDELKSLKKQIGNQQEILRLIDEKISAYPDSEIPIRYERDREKCRKKISELQDKLRLLD